MILEYVREKGKQIDIALRRFLYKRKASQVLHQAMRYAVFPGGKRIRPILAIASCEALGGGQRDILPAACAIEFIHTYSLIHDDLPVMDDDDFRRGKPSTHKAYGEATAMLAGDALLTLAFEILASYPKGKKYNDRKLEIIRCLSLACGMKGLIDGQMRDIASEGKRINAIEIKILHFKKTAALIQASLMAGAIMAGASNRERQMMSSFGKRIGLAFQITDDLLDAEGEKEIVGKETKKNGVKRKATYPSLFGIQQSRKAAQKLIKEAKEVIEPLGDKGQILSSLSDVILSRNK